VQQLPWHINFARQNGLSREEIAEAFTHLAFYAGWPAAVSALGCLEEE
jgi:4-carboxymuconolactone decarboxylase